MTEAITRIRLDRIDPSPYQTRTFTGDVKHLDELAASIRAVGVLQPILVRAGKKRGRFELIAGERRTRAAKLAGLEEILAIVHEWDDDLASEATVTENLQREDLHPLDEAAGITLLLKRHTLEEVAARIGRSAGFVARRARLTTITDRWRKALAGDDEEYDLSNWGVMHLEQIAVLPPEDQDALFESLGGYRLHISVKELQRQVSARFRTLSSAPWDQNDPAVCTGAPSCSTCSLRSAVNPQLFDGTAEDDRCMSQSCWNRKLAGHVESVVARVSKKAAGGPVLLFSDREQGKGTVRPWKYQVSKGPKGGAVPAVYVDGPRAGSVVYAKPWNDHKGSGIATDTQGPKTLEDKREGLWRRRYSRAITLMHNALTASTEIPDAAALIAIAAVVGTRFNYSSGPGVQSSASRDHQLPEGDLADLLERRSSDSAAFHARLWKEMLLPVLLSRTRYESYLNIDAAARELQAVGALIGIAFTSLLNQATAEIKEPKSWGIAA